MSFRGMRPGGWEAEQCHLSDPGGARGLLHRAGIKGTWQVIWPFRIRYFIYVLAMLDSDAYLTSCPRHYRTFELGLARFFCRRPRNVSRSNRSNRLLGNH